VTKFGSNKWIYNTTAEQPNTLEETYKATEVAEKSRIKWANHNRRHNFFFWLVAQDSKHAKTVKKKRLQLQCRDHVHNEDVFGATKVILFGSTPSPG
jgi:flagellar biosynthesis chaperone FliJ